MYVCMFVFVCFFFKVHTLSGNGFLFDRSRRDVAAYVFSRRWVVKLLGVKIMARILPIICKSRGVSSLIVDQMSYVPIDGFIAVSQSWLGFNLTSELGNMQIPTCMVVPQFDENIGHTRKLSQRELDMMPEKLVKELHYVKGYSHVLTMEQGGAELMVAKVLEFIKRAAA
jgi:hypothetical protein